MDRRELVLAMLAAANGRPYTPVQIQKAGAFYRPSMDSIQLPPREAFVGTRASSPAESYYSTLLA
jgi:antirestriction protein ArdC